MAGQAGRRKRSVGIECRRTLCCRIHHQVVTCKRCLGSDPRPATQNGGKEKRGTRQTWINSLAAMSGKPRHDEFRYGVFEAARPSWKEIAQAHGLAAKTRRRYKATTDSAHTLPLADNVLDREFEQEEAGPCVAGRYYVHLDLGRAGCTWRSCWMRTRERSSGGPWIIGCRPVW